MGSEKHQEAAEQVPEKARTFSRMISSLVQEAQAIDWYEQRMALERNESARLIMAEAQQEEMKHFCMDLAFLVTQKTMWQSILDEVFFKARKATETGETKKKAA